MTLTNRRWLLAARPEGALSMDNFARDTEQLAEPELREGEIFVQNLVFACMPTLRNWMNAPERSYRASVGLGEAVSGGVGARVLASRNPRFPVGCLLTCISRWQDYALLAPDESPTPVLRVPVGVSLIQAMSVYGPNSLTAYFGMTEVARVQPGETVVVSGAAGSTGSMAAQIARLLGCRVIGVAGGREKCDWLLETCKLDAAIDYKHEDIDQRLRELCPNGVDAFFDGVGGPVLQAVMNNIAVHGRIAVCGQISAYDSDTPAPGPRDMMKVVYWRVRIQGFVLGDFTVGDAPARAAAILRGWNEAGDLVHRVDLRHGFDALPATFLELFSGGNEGTLLVRATEDAGLVTSPAQV